MSFPKKYGGSDAPVKVLQLAKRLVPLLLEGSHPALSALCQHFVGARLKQVELTGVGFYLDFDVPSDAPLAEPGDLAGGDATITLQGFAEQGGQPRAAVRACFSNQRLLAAAGLPWSLCPKKLTGE